ncbi:hypothetical protein TorRG33x02_323720 [Trema orientale]|uniref:Uncharacterized protein n=1 Tax=Trema orientale TaxID=63057 RepID=A0A2P5BET7_TREOI|nr:hypothetical protein TorRG33x02_323720 [Trema orientale]
MIGWCSSRLRRYLAVLSGMVDEIVGHHDLFSFHKKYDKDVFTSGVIETTSNSSKLRNPSISFAKVYRDKLLHSDLARGVDMPIRFYEMILKGDFSHFARILIDIDLSQPLSDSLMFEASIETKDKGFVKERDQSCSHKKIYRLITKSPVKNTAVPIQNAFSLLRKDLTAEEKVDVVEDGMGNKNLCAVEILGDDHVDSYIVGQTVRPDSPSNLSNKIEDLDLKLVFGKKDGDDNNVNIAIDPISKKDRNVANHDVSDDSSTTGATSRRARL